MHLSMHMNIILEHDNQMYTKMFNNQQSMKSHIQYKKDDP